MSSSVSLVPYQRHILTVSSRSNNRHSTGRETLQAEATGAESKRPFICQLVTGVQSSQKSVIRRYSPSQKRTSEALGLGTLAKLPIEIRRQIWLEVLKADSYDNQHPGAVPFEYMGGRGCYNLLSLHRRVHVERSSYLRDVVPSVFRYDSYIKTDGTMYHRVEKNSIEKPRPRLASHAVKQEIEDIFLRAHHFAFGCPELFDLFFDQLGERQALQIRKFSLIIFVSYDMYVEHGWLKIIERLPKAAREVSIMLKDYRKACPPRDFALPRALTRKLLYAIDVLRNQILRQLPNARVFIKGTVQDRFSSTDCADFKALSLDQLWAKADETNIW